MTESGAFFLENLGKMMDVEKSHTAAQTEKFFIH